MLNYYQILDLDRSATLLEARVAYLRLAKELHPDLHPGDPSFVTRFQEVQEAWQVLSQTDLREDYDGFLHGFEDEGHGEDGAMRLAEQHAGYREEFLKQELLMRADPPLIEKRGSLALPVLLALSMLLLGATALEDKGQAEALHLANRLGFGPRPGQVDEIQKLGSRLWIEQQLKPDAIDDQDCDDRLKAYPDIQRSALELYKESPPRKRKKQSESYASMNAEMTDKANKQANQKLRQMHQQWNAAKLTRLTYSQRQLYELMVEFWFNHFNVSQQKNQVKWLFGPYERDVIRPHALGRFDELLLATAQSPAMLAYLDNAVSYADARYVPVAQKVRIEAAALKAAQKQASNNMRAKNKGGARGLNENYARELLELHTLGVEGGYTQQDVIEAARVLTGWGFQGPAQGQQGKKKGPYVAPFTFIFRRERHDQGEKTVLGQRYGAGQAQGEAMLAMLARHPATAKYLATKLCRRFVADEPPAALVERVAAAYLKADTDIRATLLALFETSEFLDPKYRNAKVKSPLEFVVSSLRAGAAEDVDWKRVDKMLAAMGQPLYRCEPPTGYADTADAWLSSSALLDRMNFAVLLKNPKRSPAKVDLSGLTPLAMGAPEFQRR